MNELTLLNDLFDDFEDDGYTLPSFNFKKAFAMPKVDIKESKDKYALTMDLPGKTDKDIDIKLANNILTISSEDEYKTPKEEKKEEKAESKEGAKYLIRERRYSKFSRSFNLPDDVDSEKLAATVKNGILTINMPKKAITAPKQITITCA